MKKLFLNLAVLLLFSVNIFSQEDIERKLSIKPIEMSLNKEATVGNLDCKCTKNLLKDGGFENLTNYPGSSNISSSSSPWLSNSHTPQWSPTLACCNKGMVSMWGNKTVGESIIQNNLTIVSGKKYRVKFTARFANPTSLSTFVRLKIFAFNGGAAPYNTSSNVIGISPNISGTTCATFTLPDWTATGNFNSIQLHPENDYSQNDGAYVSWIQIDNICIEEVCTIPDEKCNPGFNVNPFTLNSQCNVIINVNPFVAAGAQHYWGLTLATGLSDNTPIPLSTILSGGSFGLAVSATGVATPIGMGTGITASSSGYGYQYQGVGLGKCFKITHYIKCCNKWYSTTKTFCTKLCTEVKDSEATELPMKEAEKLEAVEANKGRG